MNSSDTQSLIQIFTHRDWGSSWLGTAMSGSVFGVFEGFIGFRLGNGSWQGIDGALFGGVAGFVIAAVVGAVIFPTVATLLWALCLLDRNKFVDKAVAGGLTGFFCAFASWPMCILTAMLGATGGCLPLLMKQQPIMGTNKTAPILVRFGIRGLFLRTFVVAILLVVWKFLMYLLTTHRIGNTIAWWWLNVRSAFHAERMKPNPLRASVYWPTHVRELAFRAKVDVTAGSKRACYRTSNAHCGK